MNFKKLTWIWLYQTSTAVLTEINLKGEQAHVAFGNSADELNAFTRGTNANQDKRRWMLPLEAYGDLPSWDLEIVQNAPHLERSNECRITAQRSRGSSTGSRG